MRECCRAYSWYVPYSTLFMSQNYCLHCILTKFHCHYPPLLCIGQCRSSKCSRTSPDDHWNSLCGLLHQDFFSAHCRKLGALLFIFSLDFPGETDILVSCEVVVIKVTTFWLHFFLCYAMPCDTIRYDTIRYDTIRYDTIRYDTIRYDTIRYGICDVSSQ